MARAAVFFLCAVLTTGIALSQDLILNGNVVNNGTISVNRDVVNNTAGAVSVTGTGAIRLIGTTAGSHSIDGGTSISFTSLDVIGSRETTVDVNTSVVDALRVGFASNAYTAGGNGFDLGANTLTLGGTATYDAASTSALTLSGGTVNYTNATAQTILTRGAAGLSTAYGTLQLSGDADFTVPAGTGGSVSSATVSHTGAGSVTVNENFNITTTGAFGTLADVASGKTVDFQSTTAASTITNLTTLAGTLRKSGDQTLGITTVTATAGTGVIDNAGTNTLTIGTLTANDGTVQSTSTGTVAFTNAAASAGTITTATGTLDFNNDIASTGTLSVTGAGFANFAAAVSSTTLTFNSASTATYDGGAQTIATPSSGGYGNLVADGSAAKSGAAGFTVASDLTLNQNIAMAASQVLTLTSTSAANVLGTGEVTGSVRRNHDFTNGESYRFNRANVYLSTATTAGTDVTLTMTPATDPTNPVTDSLVARRYGLSFATLGNVAALQLYYDSSEDDAIFYDTKIGVRTYNGTAWSKLNFASYTRTSGGSLVTLSGLNNSLASVQELGMFKINFVSRVNDAILANAGDWDENAFPDATDDLEIAHTGVTTGARALEGLTLMVNTGSDLTVNTASFNMTIDGNTANAGSISLTNADANVGALSVTGSGSLSAGSGRTLSGTSWTNNTSGTSTFAGNVSFSSLTNTAGTLNFNGGASTISGAVSNASAGAFSIGGTLSLATGGVTTVTSDGNITIAGATGVLNVGQTGVASGLSMTGTSTLTVDNAAGQLNVFGNLEFAAGISLSNVGTIVVGE